MGPNQFGRAASLQNHRVDQVSRSSHPATSISKVSSMSCDIRPLCGELTHPTSHPNSSFRQFGAHVRLTDALKRFVAFDAKSVRASSIRHSVFTVCKDG